MSKKNKKSYIPDEDDVVDDGLDEPEETTREDIKSNMRMRFRADINIALEEKKLTYKDLANYMGISEKEARIGLYEMNMDNIAKISMFLDKCVHVRLYNPDERIVIEKDPIYRNE